MLTKLYCMAQIAKQNLKRKFEEEKGAVNLIEIVAIIAVVMILVVLFKENLTELINNIFGTIGDIFEEQVVGE